MKKIIISMLGALCVITSINSNIIAHGGSISGWQYEDSDKITQSNGKHYGYHKENGIRHYHEVEWNAEEERWEIINPDIYYDENFKIISSENTSSNVSNNSSKNELNDIQKAEKIRVKYISGVDGDTARFDYNGENIKTRFLAIDTPEVAGENKVEEPYGNEARDFTKEKLKNAKEIELEFDSNSDRQDNYDRYLVWVWVDGVLLQDLLVQNGLAEVTYLYDDYKYTSQLQESEKTAKKNQVGMWNSGKNVENTVEIPNISEETDKDSIDNKENNLTGNEEERSHSNEESGSITIFGVIVAIIVVIFGLIKKRTK